MFEDASLNGMVPLTPNNESSNITRPSLPVPNIGAALTDQQDKVKNLLELTRPLTELTPASTWWRRRSMRAHTTLVGSPKYSDIYLRREKDKRDQISREAWQLASNTYKAEKLAFLRKEIKTTKNAMDKALTTARSFSTRERQQLSKGLSAAIEAEALKDKEVLKVEDNLPLRENSYQYRPHPYTWSRVVPVWVFHWEAILDLPEKWHWSVVTDYKQQQFTSPWLGKAERQNDGFEVNSCGILITHEIGLGYASLNKLCAVYGMPNTCEKTFQKKDKAPSVTPSMQQLLQHLRL